MSPCPTPDRKLKDAAQLHLLDWFARHCRALPWRKNRTPYRVWIAECMLVQTRVDQVIPYFQRFMKKFPSLRALANAPQSDVLKAWEGLGYYSRARHLHEAARHIVAQHGGRFPRDYTAIRALPGVGDYMAAAIASLAFQQDYAVLDGNVIRVLSRVTALSDEVSQPATRRHLQELANQLLLKGQAAACNEAWMELGALICLPRNPHCTDCPLHNACQAYQMGTPELYPRKKARRAVPHKEVGAAVTVDRRGRVLIAQRPDHAMLGGLWEFPGGTQEPGESMPDCVRRELQEELGITIQVGTPLMQIRHAYSHFTIRLHVYFARIQCGRPRKIECADFRWVPVAELARFAFSKADLHIVERLQMMGTHNERSLLE